MDSQRRTTLDPNPAYESRPEPSFPARAEPAPASWRYALSIKQPWASLIVAGVKIVEVRTWPTTIRGRIWIHASKIPDRREAAWRIASTPELTRDCQQQGGIIGSAELIACHAYRTPEEFRTSVARHRNEPDWFRPPVLYGFEFRDPEPVAFVPCKGNTMFFKVPGGRPT